MCVRYLFGGWFLSFHARSCFARVELLHAQVLSAFPAHSSNEDKCAQAPELAAPSPAVRQMSAPVSIVIDNHATPITRSSSLPSVPDDSAAEGSAGTDELQPLTEDEPGYSGVQLTMHDDDDDGIDDVEKHSPSPLALVITAALVLLLAHLWQLFIGGFS